MAWFSHITLTSLRCLLLTWRSPTCIDPVRPKLPKSFGVQFFPYVDLPCAVEPSNVSLLVLSASLFLYVYVVQAVNPAAPLPTNSTTCLRRSSPRRVSLPVSFSWSVSLLAAILLLLPTFSAHGVEGKDGAWVFPFLGFPIYACSQSLRDDVLFLSPGILFLVLVVHFLCILGSALGHHLHCPCRRGIVPVHFVVAPLSCVHSLLAISPPLPLQNSVLCPSFC